VSPDTIPLPVRTSCCVTGSGLPCRTKEGRAPGRSPGIVGAAALSASSIASNWVLCLRNKALLLEVGGAVRFALSFSFSSCFSWVMRDLICFPIVKNWSIHGMMETFNVLRSVWLGIDSRA